LSVTYTIAIGLLDDGCIRQNISYIYIYIYIYIHTLQHDAVAPDGMATRKVRYVPPPECSCNEARQDKKRLSGQTSENGSSVTGEGNKEDMR